ncbi:MAG TPA: phage holin family protein [Nocardioides sp.]|nr:phage holin family protein [Nocardioides sp.]
MATARPLLRGGLHAQDLGAAALAVIGASIGLLITSWLVPETDIGGGPVWLLVSGLLVSVCGVVLRIVLVPVAARLGWVGAILLGLLGQTIAVWLVVFAPTSSGFESWWWALVAAWIVAAVSTLLVWLATAGTEDAVTASLLRRARRRRTTVDDPTVPGVVFVQADGVPFPVLQWGVRAGTLPTLSRWLRDGSHHMAEWRPKLPATTPASQMGILHGTIDGIPAFRWVDRTDGKTYVANKPKDAALIEEMHSDGRGLLADDGVSISNLFTGDAPIAVATMSAVDRSRESRQARLALTEFLGRPSGFARAMIRTVSEIVRERFQAAKARRRDIRPRVHRGWSFAIERAALIGVMRDLNTTLVADAMLLGRRSIYVDYVDYDAVAHHAGILQPESLDALGGIDAVLAQLERVAEVAPRPYHIVVLSDHGQSQGTTFADRYGEDLAALVSRLAEESAVAAVENDEGKGSLNSMVASAGDQRSTMGRALDRVSGRLTEPSTTEPSTTEPSAADPEATADVASTTGSFVVFGSGNLGLIYVAGESARVPLEDLRTRFPGLVPGLVAHPGVGFVVAHSTEDGIVVLGAEGEHRLRDGRVTGVDPLARYGPMAPAFVTRAAEMSEAPDLYVNSLVDDLDEVAAFEGLVGCHGGLGGWQDRAMLVHPTALRPPEGLVVGADAMHRVLVGWLEDLGHRQELRGKVTT